MCARGCLRQKYSWQDVQRKRLAVADLLRQQSIKLEFFNGGGSGGLATSCSDPSLTEVGGCCAVLCCVESAVYAYGVGGCSGGGWVGVLATHAVRLLCREPAGASLLLCTSGDSM